MPRPKKVVATETIETAVENTTNELLEEVEEKSPVQVQSEEKPPEQFLIPFYIKALKTKDDDDEDDDEGDISDEISMTVSEASNEESISDQQFTKFAVYSHQEYVTTVDDESAELLSFLEFNRAELDSRINELWQTPSDPNDLIFFNFGEQKMIYNSYNAYFNVNGFAPVEPSIKSWMEYYLNKHNPITPEEVAIQLKGPLQYSFIPIKS